MAGTSPAMTELWTGHALRGSSCDVSVRSRRNKVPALHQMKSEIRDGMKIDWDAPIVMDDGVTLRADVFQPQPAPLAAVSKRVKESFDPKGVLNSGRMWAGV